MTFLLAVAILLSVFVVWMVTTPLFSAQNMEVFSVSYKGFSDENELKQVLLLRDRLLARLVTGASDDARVGGLSEDDCFQALVSLSLRLQRAELPFLPAEKSQSSATGNNSGHISYALLLSLGALFLGMFVALKSSQAFAQPTASASNASSISAPLHLVEPGFFAPQVNRYMLSPAQGFVVGHHLTAFSIPSTLSDGLVVVLPLPENIYDWQLVAVRPEALQKQIVVENWHGAPALKIPKGTQGLVVDVSSEFRLNAFAGKAIWQNQKFPEIPGEQVVVMPEAGGVLRTLFGPMAQRWNIWPPRMLPFGEEVKVVSRELAMNPEAPPRQFQILSRQAEIKQSFFRFEIVGLAPSRLPLIVLGALVGAILLGVALFVFVRSVRWRIDSSSSLPG